ncbi:hypothetical protein DAPK24_035670 [Pichia kluyveri]|uniref:Ty3 transposon capsid-like protein domain-containing protein n=1 Tax=Pichia kluyveri TaxID=36015 RepID=A0AAV5R7J8_PICKL|nr:hypothetical protein DAPK24_035670 [Pichia kluyveri]
MTSAKDKINALKQQIKEIKLTEKKKKKELSKKHSTKHSKNVIKKKKHIKLPLRIIHSDPEMSDYSFDDAFSSDNSHSDNSNSDSDISDSDTDTDDDNKTSKNDKLSSNFPKFDGSSTDDKGKEFSTTEAQLKAKTWLSKLHVNLIDKGISKSSWARKAIVNLEGRAYKWVEHKLEKNPKYLKISWERFLRDFKKEFCPVIEDDMHAMDYKILTFKMVPGMKVSTYSDQFKEYIQELDFEESTKFQISRYLLGLTPELKKMVSQQKPRTLNAAIHYAEDSEAIVKDIEKPKPADPWINYIQHTTPNQDPYYQPYYQPYNQPYYYN